MPDPSPTDFQDTVLALTLPNRSCWAHTYCASLEPTRRTPGCAVTWSLPSSAQRALGLWDECSLLHLCLASCVFHLRMILGHCQANSRYQRTLRTQQLATKLALMPMTVRWGHPHPRQGTHAEGMIPHPELPAGSAQFLLDVLLKY